MRFSSPLIPATFRERPNRFLGHVELKGERMECFIPNPGRMRELLRPGVKVHLLEKWGPRRRTRYDLVLVEYDGTLVSIDSRTPNRVLREAIQAGRIPEFDGLRVERMEPTFQDSRFDLLLRGERSTLILEAKSCTLVEEGVALFPDAPTKRGTRHLKTLVKALEIGRAAIFFLIQRNDAEAFTPHEAMDPGFAEALREAASAGVEVYAYDSTVTLTGVALNMKLPVILQLSP